MGVKGSMPATRIRCGSACQRRLGQTEGCQEVGTTTVGTATMEQLHEVAGLGAGGRGPSASR